MGTVILDGKVYTFTSLLVVPPPVQPPYVKIGSPSIIKNGQNIVVTHSCDSLTDMDAALDLVTVNTTDCSGIYGDQKKT